MSVPSNLIPVTILGLPQYLGANPIGWFPYVLEGVTYSAQLSNFSFGTGTVNSVGGTGSVNGITLTGTVTSTGNLTLGGALTGVSLTTQVAGVLPFANGGTGFSSYTNGQLLIGNTATGGISRATLTAGTGVTITNGNGTITISAPDNGTVSSVDVSGGTTGLVYTGGPITTSGTVTASGTLIAANGGTGFSSYAVGDLLQAATTTTLAKLAAVATGNALLSGGVNTASAWGKVGLTTHVSGTLPIANGGTGQTGSAAAFNALSPITTAGDLILGNGANSATRLGIGSNTFVLTSNGTTASWAAPATAGTVTSVSGTGTVNGITLTGTVTSTGNITLGGALSGVSLTTQVTGTLPVANGGTGITALGTGVATALGINVGSAGAFVTFNGAGGTPSSLVLTNATGLPIGSVGSGVASAANMRVGTNAVTVVAPSSVFAGAAEVTVAYSATTTFDLTTFFNASVTLTGNVTFANPSAGMDSGRSGVIYVIQDSTGSRTVAFGNQWKFPGGAPTASTAANAVDAIAYEVRSSTWISGVYIKAFA